MDQTQIYVAIRSEIVANHELLHWFTLIVALSLVIGIVVIERLGNTLLSIFLPLLSVSWAASVLRFDFFIHRQAAYLRMLEAQSGSRLWESWKASLNSSALVIPTADLFASAVIVVPTLYIVFGPAQNYFASRNWKGARLYAFSISVILLLLLVSLIFVPKVASY
ncbi:MAG TPA: hypothetical protein VI306_11900 [Pyrinomonadaceae bacterium]